MARAFATAGLCILAALASVGSAWAQAPASEGATRPVAAQPSPRCVGVLCGLTPAGMDRPVGAEDARRMQAESARQAAEATPAPSTPKRDRHRHFARSHDTVHARGRSIAMRAQTPRQRHAEAKALVASRPEAKPSEMKRVEEGAKRVAAVPDTAKDVGSINAIFVLAPLPFDPYGGDYAPWLDRLSWSTHFDRADDRMTFAPDGYRETESLAPVAETGATQAADELARRTDALSQRGFQALKVDLGRS